VGHRQPVLALAVQVAAFLPEQQEEYQP